MPSWFAPVRRWLTPASSYEAHTMKPQVVVSFFSWEMALGVTILLVGMTIVTRLASSRMHSGPRVDLLDEVWRRIKTWWLIATIFVVGYFGGTVLTLLLMSMLSFYALREFLSLTPTRISDHYTVALAFYLILPLQYVFIGLGWYAWFIMFIPIYAYLFLPLMSLFKQDTNNFLARVSTVQWGLMAAVFCLSHMAALPGLEIKGYEGRGHYLVAYLLLVTQLAEAAQELVDYKLGQWKMAPDIDKSRSWEGFFVAMGVGVMSAVLLSRYTPFDVLGAFAIGIALVLADTGGSLIMSAVKRDANVKDFGGVLDRLKGLCFAAPVFFHIVRYMY
jgi:phosphatidate cytidylyltransferase